MIKAALLLALLALFYTTSFAIIVNPGTPDKSGFQVALNWNLFSGQHTVSFSGDLSGTPFQSLTNQDLISYPLEFDDFKFQWLKQYGRLYTTFPFRCRECTTTLLNKKIQWDKINYVLNNRGSYDPRTIRDAIWQFSDDPSFINSIIGMIFRPRNALIEEANAKGSGFVPAPGQWTASLVQPSLLPDIVTTLEGRMIVPYKLPPAASSVPATSSAKPATSSAQPATSSAQPATSSKAPAATSALPSGFPGSITWCTMCQSIPAANWCIDKLTGIGRCSLKGDITCTAVTTCCSVYRNKREQCVARPDCKYCKSGACNKRK